MASLSEYAEKDEHLTGLEGKAGNLSIDPRKALSLNIDDNQPSPTRAYLTISQVSYALVCPNPVAIRCLLLLWYCRRQMRKLPRCRNSSWVFHRLSFYQLALFLQISRVVGGSTRCSTLASTYIIVLDINL